MKILGESLHEMSTLYRQVCHLVTWHASALNQFQAKQKISEQKDDIENLKEQLKVRR